jgi:polysaccharide pyruvyl transferase WcaK-like protein
MKRILHIASFDGNIGDNASHIGFDNILSLLDLDLSIDRLEIRKAYNNYKGKDKILFDETFAEEANNYDYVIFGGGGFLDYWVENSPTGTTISLTETAINKLTTNVLITSVGAHPNKKVPEKNYELFRSFINKIAKKDNFTVALRNDGSKDSLCSVFDNKFASNFNEVLDHGFYYKPKIEDRLKIEGDYICFNVTKDQVNMYNNGNKIEDFTSYFHEISSLVISIINDYGYKVVFMPHIYSDISAISELFDYLPDWALRNEIIVAPYIQGDDGCDFIFNTYVKSSGVIASRYHANVVALDNGINCFGLSPLSRIKSLNEDLDNHFGYAFPTPGFSKEIISFLFESKVDNRNAIMKSLISKKEKTLEFYCEYFSDMSIGCNKS